jgi:hypothetical protein
MKETDMKTIPARRTARAAFVLVMMTGSPSAFGQPAPGARNVEEAIQRAQRQNEIQQVLGDKAGGAAALVARWRNCPRGGPLGQSYPVDCSSPDEADPESLLAAGKASATRR